MQREPSKLRFVAAASLLGVGVIMLALLQLLYGALAIAAGAILLHYAPVGHHR